MTQPGIIPTPDGELAEFIQTARSHGAVIARAEDIGINSGPVHRRVVGRAWKRFLRERATTEELKQLAQEHFEAAYSETFTKLVAVTQDAYAEAAVEDLEALLDADD